MRKIFFMLSFITITLFSSEDNYTPVSQGLPEGYEVVSTPNTEKTPIAQEDHMSTVTQWIIRSSILALIIYFSLRRRDKTQEKIELVEDMQASVFHPQEVYEEKLIRESKLSLFQRIKAQPIAVKRFFILLSILWILFETFIDFQIFGWDRYDFRHKLDNYFIITYMPIIIIYGIYWIISGIKKES